MAMSFFDEPPLHDFPDRAFRLLLAQPANLREVVEQVAPHLAPNFDFEQRQQIDRELPMPDWRRREADMLFLVPFREAAEKTVLVCVLIEHQSTQDASMPLRTLLYAVLFWEREWRAWEEKHERGQPLRLSPVLPIVFHTGGQPWTTNRTLADLIAVPEELRIYLPSWQPLFWDLAIQTAEDLVQFVGALHNALAVVRAENEETEEFQALYNDLLARLDHLREQEKMRRNDLLCL